MRKLSNIVISLIIIVILYILANLEKLWNLFLLYFRQFSRAYLDLLEAEDLHPFAIDGPLRIDIKHVLDLPKSADKIVGKLGLIRRVQEQAVVILFL